MPNKTTDMRIHICIGRKSGHRTQNMRGQMAAVIVIVVLIEHIMVNGQYDTLQKFEKVLYV